MWVAARFVEAVSLFTASFFIRRKISPALLTSIYTTTIGCIIISIMWLRFFPSCYIEGAGLTVFKIASEYLICLILLGAAWRFFILRKHLPPFLYVNLIFSLAFTIFSELSFTLYSDVYGKMNFLGHIFKLLSFYFIFRGVIPMFERPYDIISNELKKCVLLDYLTGLYNRRGFIEFTEKELARASREGNDLGIILLDLDKFKNVNDMFGHIARDKTLKSCTRKNDIACRLGGDEFVVLVTNGKDIPALMQRIRREIERWIISNKIARKSGISVSIGSSIWNPGRPKDIDLLIKEADQKMYQEKKSKTPERNTNDL